MICYYWSLLCLVVYLHENWHCLKHICLCLIWYQEKHLTNKKSTSTSSLNCPTIMQLESWVCAHPDTLRSKQNLWKPYTSDHSTFHLSTNSKTCFVLRHDSEKMMTLISWVLIQILDWGPGPFKAHWKGGVPWSQEGTAYQESIACCYSPLKLLLSGHPRGLGNFFISRKCCSGPLYSLIQKPKILQKVVDILHCVCGNQLSGFYSILGYVLIKKTLHNEKHNENVTMCISEHCGYNY